MGHQWSWGITGYEVSEKDNAEIIELCRYAGVASVEANRQFVDDKSTEEIQEIREQYEQASLSVGSFHLPFGSDFDIADFYETRRKKHVDGILEYMEKASLLGSRVCILHPSASEFDVKEEGMDRYMRCMGKSLEVLLPRAEDLGVKIALENMLPGEVGVGGRFGSEPEHFELFTREFVHPNLGYCLDTGHAQVVVGADGPGRFFDVMKDRLIAFHLQDNPGDRDLHLAPGHGLVDWNTVFKRMSDIKYPHPAVIEAPPFSRGLHKNYGRDAWKNMIDRMEGLVDDA